MASKRKFSNIVDVETPPSWFRRILEKAQGDITSVKFIMEKNIFLSDLNRQQNRLLIPSCYVQCNLLPILTQEEFTSAFSNNANVVNVNNQNIYGNNVAFNDRLAIVPHVNNAHNEKKRKKMEVGRQHGGLPVSVYVGHWRFDLLMTRWDKSGGTVLKGSEWRCVVAWANIKVGDVVHLWSFRSTNGKLCFAIAKEDDEAKRLRV